MEAVNFAGSTTIMESEVQATITRISKRISKLIVKELLKSRIKDSTTLLTLKDYVSIPINYTYDGKYINCLFFKKSLKSEEISVLPSDVSNLFLNICINIEKIFAALPSMNVRNVDFKLISSESGNSQCIVIFSYTAVM